MWPFRPNIQKLIQRRDIARLARVMRGCHVYLSSRPAVQRAAAAALGQLGDRRAVEPLVDFVSKTRYGWVDVSAMRALGRLRDDRAVQPLCAVLTDENRNIEAREAAARALARIGNPAAVEPLCATLPESYKNLRATAARALDRLGLPYDETIRAQHAVAKQDWDTVVAIGAPALEAIHFVLEDKSVAVRTQAAAAVRAIGGEVQHDWSACVCRICGRLQHTWDGDTCRVCGRVRASAEQKETET